MESQTGFRGLGLGPRGEGLRVRFFFHTVADKNLQYP